MSYDYEALYASTPNALGDPNPKISAFFDGPLPSGLRVLDIGCGQGRDAIPVARRGHSVVGVDLAPSGIASLNAVAAAEGLDLIGIAADLAAYTPDGMFDVLLIDRTLHMLDEAPRHDVFARLLEAVSLQGWLLLLDESSNMAGLKCVIDQASSGWKVETAVKGQLFAQRIS